MKTFVGDFLVRPHCFKTPPRGVDSPPAGRVNKQPISSVAVDISSPQNPACPRVTSQAGRESEAGVTP